MPSYPTASSLKMSDIERYVVQACGFTRAELRAHDRSWRVSHKRHFAMYAMRDLTSNSLPAISKYMCGMDHTTVIYAVRKIRNLMWAAPHVVVAFGVPRDGGEDLARLVHEAQCVCSLLDWPRSWW